MGDFSLKIIVAFLYLVKGAKVVGLAFLTVEIAALIINSRLSIFIFKTCVVDYGLIIGGIVVGGLIILVAVVGCCWVIKKSTKLLIHYQFGLVVALVASSGLCFCTFFRMLYSRKFSDELSDLYHTYNRSAKAEKFWNNLQSNAWCCGIEGPEDWKDDIPISCCTSNSADYTKYSDKCQIKISNRPYTYADGCEAILKRYIANLNYYTFYPSLGLILFTIFMFIFVFNICRAALKREQQSRRESEVLPRENDSVYSVELFNCWKFRLRFCVPGEDTHIHAHTANW